MPIMNIMCTLLLVLATTSAHGQKTHRRNQSNQRKKLKNIGATEQQGGSSVLEEKEKVMVDWAWVKNGACPTECGLSETVVTITVNCESSTGEIDATGEACTAAKPETQMTCTATTACDSYTWIAGKQWHAKTYAECEERACGLPAETLLREVTCHSSTGTEADISNCEGEHPAKELDCPATRPCIVYSWQLGNWTDDCPTCGTSAGEHTRTRDVQCVGSDKKVASDSDCEGSIPPSSEDCPATVDCETFSWLVGEVTCVDTCGIEAHVVSRDVLCVGSSDSSAEATACDGVEQPANYVECPATDNCELFAWVATDFVCNLECGVEEHNVTRDVDCQRTETNSSGVVKISTVDDDICAGQKPDDITLCAATSACALTCGQEGVLCDGNQWHYRPNQDDIACINCHNDSSECCHQNLCWNITCSGHGTCSHIHGSDAHCECEDGWEGDTCSTERDPCDLVSDWKDDALKKQEAIDAVMAEIAELESQINDNTCDTTTAPV